MSWCSASTMWVPGGQAWWQVPIPAEPSLRLSIYNSPASVMLLLPGSLNDAVSFLMGGKAWRALPTLLEGLDCILHTQVQQLPTTREIWCLWPLGPCTHVHILTHGHIIKNSKDKSLKMTLCFLHLRTGEVWTKLGFRWVPLKQAVLMLLIFLWYWVPLILSGL